MVNFGSAIHPNPPVQYDEISEGLENANGIEVHAGLYETSQVLFLRPDLVHSEYTNLRTYTVGEFEDLQRYAQDKDWPGYFGAPQFASADIGANSMRTMSENINDLAIKILDGLDPSSLSSYTDSQNPVLLLLDEEILNSGLQARIH